MNILFYVDDRAESGLGHVRRSEALAHTLESRGAKVDFALRSDAYDIGVIDRYDVLNRDIERMRARCKRLVGFHDMGQIDQRFSLVISTVIGKNMRVGDVAVLGGHEYRIVHPEVRARSPIVVKEHIEKIIVTLGSAPTMAMQTARLVEALKRALPHIRFEPIAGLSPGDALAAYGSADVAICAGGQTLIELSYLGVPIIAVIASEDQGRQVDDALAHDAVVVAGRISDTGVAMRIAAAIDSLYSADARGKLSVASKHYIDGRGAERIVEALERLI
ncbi:MAG: hypothetical protein RLZZ416_526 [Candidatus Parcubacteria bacterium]